MTTLTYNPITDTDSYKFSHYLQYPEGTTMVNAYIESRGGPYKDVVFLGFQAFAKAYLSQPITQDDIEEAEPLVLEHGLPFNREGFQKIVDKWGGYWPVDIFALPEGTVVPPHTPLLQVRNLGGQETMWVTTFLETALLRAIWYPTTVATRSRYIKTIIKKYLELTADNLGGLNFKLHDFGARGVSSRESSYLGGMGHLVNFMGTDTFEALRAAKKYYGEPMAGYSIPAAEHSTITAWTRKGESDAYRNMIRQFAGPNKLFAVVSDTYNIYDAVREIWPTMNDELIGAGGTLVIRPDSGVPHVVVLKLLDILTDKFGYKINTKGYKMLPDHIRLIQGDGINDESVELILKTMMEAGYSADNIAFGMGGELLQTVNRDTCKFAMKASAVEVDGQLIGVSKAPIDDPTKRSKEGILKVVQGDDLVYRTLQDFEYGRDLLDLVWTNGNLEREQTFQDIRYLAEV